MEPWLLLRHPSRNLFPISFHVAVSGIIAIIKLLNCTNSQHSCWHLGAITTPCFRMALICPHLVELAKHTFQIISLKAHLYQHGHQQTLYSNTVMLPSACFCLLAPFPFSNIYHCGSCSIFNSFSIWFPDSPPPFKSIFYHLAVCRWSYSAP